VTPSDQASTDAARTATDGRFLAGTDGETAGRQRSTEIEARYRALVDHLPAVLYIDGAASGTTMLDVSPRIQDLLGITPAERIANGSSARANDRSRRVTRSASSIAASTATATSCGSARRRF
jgi:PAS domain-containing protein